MEMNTNMTWHDLQMISQAELLNISVYKALHFDWEDTWTFWILFEEGRGHLLSADFGKDIYDFGVLLITKLWMPDKLDLYLSLIKMM